MGALGAAVALGGLFVSGEPALAAPVAAFPAPTDISCVPNGVGSFDVQWTPSVDGNDLTSITLSDWLSGQTFTISADDMGYNEAEIDGLDPNRRYALSLRENTANGSTDYSDSCDQMFPRPDPGNLVLNPDGDAGTAYWQSLNGTVSSVTGGSPGHGTKALKATRATATSYNVSDSAVAGTVPTVPSTDASSYFAAAWVKAGSPSAVGKPVIIGLRERNASGSVIHDTTSAAKKLTAGWQQIWVTAPIAAYGDSLGVRIEQRNAAAGNAIIVDDIRVHRSGGIFSIGSPQTVGVIDPNVKRVSATSFDVCSHNDPLYYDPCTYEYDLTSLRVYVDGRAGGKGSAPIRGVIYRVGQTPDYQTALPTSLVASTSSKTITSGQGPGWIDLPLPAPLEISSYDSYWFGVQVGGTTRIVRFYGDDTNGYYGGPDTAANTAWTKDAFADGPSKSFGPVSSGSVSTMTMGVGGN